MGQPREAVYGRQYVIAITRRYHKAKKRADKGKIPDAFCSMCGALHPRIDASTALVAVVLHDTGKYAAWDNWRLDLPSQPTSGKTGAP